MNFFKTTGSKRDCWYIMTIYLTVVYGILGHGLPEEKKNGSNSTFSGSKTLASVAFSFTPLLWEQKQ